MMMRMQNAEAERKKAIEKQEKLEETITDLKQKLDHATTETTRLQSQLTTLTQQIQKDQTTITQLQHQNQQLTKELQDQAEKEIKDQEVLKAQYQRLMKERLNEERKQFETRLKTTPTAATVEENTSTRSSFDSNSTTTPVVSSIMTERLQANIRQLENQLSFYQTQLQSASQTRDELSDEILSMSQELESLRKQLKHTTKVENQYQQLNARYQTLLELLGERTEEVEELKADLIDVKEMYKSQILELVKNKK